MKVGTLVNARMGSSRLPGKHFKLIEDQPALSHLLNRLSLFSPVIAAPEGDTELAQLGAAEYGDALNIPLRHLQIAERLGLDAIISIDGDDLLTSPTAAGDAIAALEHHPIVRTTGLPVGMNVLWGYTVNALRAALADGPRGQNDTGWGWIFPPPHVIRYAVPGADRIRVTLDTPDDLRYFRGIFSRCPPALDDAALTRWLAENSDSLQKTY